MHYGSERTEYGTSNFTLFHELGREGVQTSKQTCERSGAKLTVQSKQTGERCEETIERMNERPSTFFNILIFGRIKPACGGGGFHCQWHPNDVDVRLAESVFTL